MIFVTYYIVSKGKIVYSQSEVVDNEPYRLIELPREARINMIPRSSILVVTVINTTLVYDIVTINSELLTNNVIKANHEKPMDYVSCTTNNSLTSSKID